MLGEAPARLDSIHDELRATVRPDYWEVSNRGVNFDYLPPERRRQLDVFFRWLHEARAGRTEV